MINEESIQRSNILTAKSQPFLEYKTKYFNEYVKLFSPKAV